MEASKETVNSSAAASSELAVFMSSPAELATRFSSHLESGLSASEAQHRLKEHGPNALSGGGGVSPVKILLTQMGNAMTAVLYICMAVSGGIKSWIEFGVLGAIVVINIVSADDEHAAIKADACSSMVLGTRSLGSSSE